MESTRGGPAVAIPRFSLFLLLFLSFTTSLTLAKYHMRYVGIDMSKADFHASFDESGRTEVFANSPDGYRSLAARLAERGFAEGDTRVGTEATGTYHLPLASFLSRAGWEVAVINPIVTSRLAKAKVRSAKTDRIDAGVVRRAAAQGEGYRFLETPEATAMKSLASQRAALVAARAGMRRRVEAAAFRDRASGLAPHDAYGPVIEAMGREIGLVEEIMAGMAAPEQALLRSIPGIGAASSAALVAAVADIRRFDHPKKLVAYLGLDCRVHESGASVRGKGFLTKRGDGRVATCCTWPRSPPRGATRSWARTTGRSAPRACTTRPRSAPWSGSSST